MGKDKDKAPPLEDGAKVMDVESERLIDTNKVTGDVPKPANRRFKSDLIKDEEEEEDDEDESEEEEEDEDDVEEDDEPGRIDPCMEEEAKKFEAAIKKVQSRCAMQNYFTENRKLFSAQIPQSDIKKTFVEGPLPEILREIFIVKEQPLPADPVLMRVDKYEWIIRGGGVNIYRIDVEEKSITVFTYEFIANELVVGLFDTVVNTQNIKELADVLGLKLEDLEKGEGILAVIKGMQSAKEYQDQAEKEKGEKANYNKMFQ
jgi:hypothetical protein